MAVAEYVHLGVEARLIVGTGLVDLKVTEGRHHRLRWLSLYVGGLMVGRTGSRAVLET